MAWATIQRFSQSRWLFALTLLAVLAGGFIAHHLTGRPVNLAGAFFIVFSGLALDGLKRGEIAVKMQRYRRAESPIAYWLFVLMWAMFAVAFGVLTWVIWDSPGAPLTPRR